ncbi:MAG TPA: hypothetical protein VK988_09880 [Acidimicrobiales bacterium]|nr:hypothetical protein [Acidimicrobiales bacterium]
MTKAADSAGRPVYCFDLAFVPASVIATAEGSPATWSTSPIASLAGSSVMAELPCPRSDAAITYGGGGVNADSFYVVFR